jgi:hypothetical protein
MKLSSRFLSGFYLIQKAPGCWDNARWLRLLVAAILTHAPHKGYCVAGVPPTPFRSALLVERKDKSFLKLVTPHFESILNLCVPSFLG